MTPQLYFAPWPGENVLKSSKKHIASRSEQCANSGDVVLRGNRVLHFLRETYFRGGAPTGGGGAAATGTIGPGARKKCFYFFNYSSAFDSKTRDDNRVTQKTRIDYTPAAKSLASSDRACSPHVSKLQLHAYEVRFIRLFRQNKPSVSLT